MQIYLSTLTCQATTLMLHLNITRNDLFFLRVELCKMFKFKHLIDKF